MPVAPEEVLKALQVAVEEARAATREAHEAHKMLRQHLKDQQRLIVETLRSEVADAVKQLEATSAAEMKERCGQVVDGIAADWRSMLGLA